MPPSKVMPLPLVLPGTTSPPVRSTLSESLPPNPLKVRLVKPTRAGDGVQMTLPLSEMTSLPLPSLTTLNVSLPGVPSRNRIRCANGGQHDIVAVAARIADLEQVAPMLVMAPSGRLAKVPVTALLPPLLMIVNRSPAEGVNGLMSDRFNVAPPRLTVSLPPVSTKLS